MAGFSPRTIVESEDFASQRARIQPVIRLWDAFWFGLDWTLSANPEAGEQAFDLPLWILTTVATPGVMPRLRILYRFDENTITLLRIELAR